ncbi:MAG: hypothetical protein IJX17_07180 [Clostridia bacterium]|nr:hypothetical protein [Clostridia bacterium]
MSRIIFLTSENEINLEKFGLKFIEKTKYLDKYFPYLKDKNFVFDFSDYNGKCSYKEFVLDLIDLSKNNNEIRVVVLWQTENMQEVEELNTFIYNKIEIISESNFEKKYDLIYRFENDSFDVSSEFVIKH